MSIKIKYNFPKNHVVLAYDKKVSRHFWRIAIATGEISKREIVRIAKTISILKRPINKPFPIEYTYHDTNQTDKAREQKLR